MEPSVCIELRSVRHDDGAVDFGLTAQQAATRYRGRCIPIQPFDNAAFQGLSLGVGTGQPAGKLGKGCTLLEQEMPVIR
jgi:hypothetical protein